jgi:hypothetical protein
MRKKKLFQIANRDDFLEEENYFKLPIAMIF